MGKHSAANDGSGRYAVSNDGRAPASTAFGGRKKEIIRLDHENERLFADNQRLFSDNTTLSEALRTAQADLERIHAIDVLGREGTIRDLDRQIAQHREQVEVEKKAKADELAQLSAKARDELAQQEKEKERIVSEIASLTKDLDKTQKALLDVRDTASMHEVGLYDYENPAESSVKLKEQLAANKQKQKQMVRDGKAVKHITNFTFNNSAAQGNRMLSDMAKMALSLYNAEAENCVKNMKAGNLDTNVARLNRCAERIERFGKMVSLAISKAYQQLRVKELSLTAMYLQAVQAEKEAEKERRAELREQAKAQKELDAEMARLRKEQEHYQNVLQRMREQGDNAEVAKLEEKLAQIDKAVNDVDYRSANIRAGYVYVISDIGAFGERMVKIGMTRRLDPMDRVRELSDASVPFRFDVHALFFSKDAVSLETMLHHEFEDRRVNKVNARKEFYYVTPQEVLDKLREKDIAVVEFRVEPEAEEYRISQQIADGRGR